MKKNTANQPTNPTLVPLTIEDVDKYRIMSLTLKAHLASEQKQNLINAFLQRNPEGQMAAARERAAYDESDAAINELYQRHGLTSEEFMLNLDKGQFEPKKK